MSRATTFRRLLAAVAVFGLSLHLISEKAFCATTYDDNVTPDIIFGSGNDNGGFTIDRSVNGIELGLRGKLRHNASGNAENTWNSNGDGSYTFNAGVAPTQSGPTAEWSFEWSINSDHTAPGIATAFLSYYDYALTLSGPGITTPVSFDPINGVNGGLSVVQWDHAIGTNATANGGGTSIPNSPVDLATVGAYKSLIDYNNVAQNSWKPHWFISGFDPNLTGTYTISLSAMQKGTVNVMASTSIDVNVVPEPSSALLAGLGMLGLGFLRRRNR